MFIKKTYVVLWISLLLIGMLTGCGGEGSAGHDMSMSTSNNEVNLESISVTPINPSLAENTTQQFTAIGIYSDSTTKDLTSSVIWTSSDVDTVDIASGVDGVGITASSPSVAGAVEANRSPGHTIAKNSGEARITAQWGNISGYADVTVTPATLVSIAITPTNPGIAMETTQQFTVMGTFSDDTMQDLTESTIWMSSNAAVATFTDTSGSKGRATGIAAGLTTITATSGNISGSTTLTVTSATLVSLAVTPTNPSIAKGTTQQFTATGTFSDSTTQDMTTAVSWDSSITADGTISNAAGSNGLASAVAAGSTTITATSGSISGSTTLTVTLATLVSLAVTPANPSIVKGTTRQFTATGTYSDSSTQDLTTAVTWGSSAVFVATISNAGGSKGLSTSVDAGSTTITATSGSVSGTATLTVTSAILLSLSVTPTNPSIAQGTTRQFTATGTYSDSTTQDLTTAVTWDSSTGIVATISNAAGSRGLSTSVGAGLTTITATSGSVSGTATLTVVETGDVTLTWDAPTTYTDNSTLDPLTGLSLYKIYYGTAPYMYTQVVNVANPGTTTITQTLNLAAGTYYFVVTTVDVSGMESDYSNEVIKTL